jgi:hypothetical protein
MKLQILKQFINWIKAKIKLPLLMVISLILGIMFIIIGITFKKGGLTIGAISGIFFGVFLTNFIGLYPKAHNDRQNQDLIEKNEKLKNDLKISKEYLRNGMGSVKIIDLKSILKVEMLQVKFNTTKYFDYFLNIKKMGQKRVDVVDLKGKYRFIGGLNAEFTANYGLDIKEIKVKVDNENHRFYVSGANSKFLGFGEFPNLNWQSNLLLRKLGPQWIESNDQMKNEIGNNKKEMFADEYKKGPKDIDFIENSLNEQIRNIIKVILAPTGYSVELVGDDIGQKFIPLVQYIKMVNDNAINVKKFLIKDYNQNS